MIYYIIYNRAEGARRVVSVHMQPLGGVST